MVRRKIDTGEGAKISGVLVSVLQQVFGQLYLCHTTTP